MSVRKGRGKLLSSNMETLAISSSISSRTRLTYTQNTFINKQLAYVIIYGHLLINNVFASERNSTKTDILNTSPKSNIESYFESNVIDTSDDAVFEIKLNPKYDANNVWLRDDKQMYKYVIENPDADANITTHKPIGEAVVNDNIEVNIRQHSNNTLSANITTVNSKVIHTLLHNTTDILSENSTEHNVGTIQSDKNRNRSLENVEKELGLSKKMNYDHIIKSNISFIDTKSESPVKERYEISAITEANFNKSAGSGVKAINDKAEPLETNLKLDPQILLNNSIAGIDKNSSNTTDEVVHRLEPYNKNSTNCRSGIKANVSIPEDSSHTSINKNKTQVFTQRDVKNQVTAENTSVINSAKWKQETSVTKSRNHDTDVSNSYTSVTDFHEVDFDSVEEELEDYDTKSSTELTTKKAPTSDPFSAVLGFAGNVAETVAERVLPKWIIDVMKRMQKQNTQLETIRLRSREENGGIGQFGRNILKGLSTGIYQPLNVWIQGVRDYGSLDSDKNFFSGVASGVVGVADGVVNMASGVLESFKDRVQAIYPGTLWCGDGHMAREQELGLFFFTDTCCRHHDECKLYIASGETRFGLTNTGLFTRSHCSCDDSFRQCLKRTGSLVSSQIGLTFFNVLGPQCFKKSHPIVRCMRRTRITGQKCEQYELDYTKPKMWQWFDNETF